MAFLQKKALMSGLITLTNTASTFNQQNKIAQTTINIFSNSITVRENGSGGVLIENIPN